MHDQAEIAADPYRPEVRVSRMVELVQLHARVRLVELQIKGGGFDRFLLFAGQPRQALREGVGNAEFHCCILRVGCCTSERSLHVVCNFS